MRTISSVRILADAETAPTAGRTHTPVFHEKRTFQATGSTTSGADGTATILIEASNVDTPAVDGDWVLVATLSLTATPNLPAKETVGFATDAPWRHVRARLTAVTGTTPVINVWMGA